MNFSEAKREAIRKVEMLRDNRIQLNDSPIEALVKMSDGNPGAANVLGGFLQRQGIVGIIHICKLDDLKIYGSKIWLLWKDLLGCDAEAFDDALINNKVRELVAEKCIEDESFKKEWDYYGAKAAP